MNPNAKKWVEELRSGKYGQGKGHLRSADNEYCCLGVACELYRQDTGGGEWKSKDNGEGGKSWAFHLREARYGAVLPEEVRAWLDLVDHQAGYEVPSTNALTAKNDEGMTFDEIANLIESEPKGLFT